MADPDLVELLAAVAMLGTAFGGVCVAYLVTRATGKPPEHTPRSLPQNNADPIPTQRYRILGGAEVTVTEVGEHNDQGEALLTYQEDDGTTHTATVRAFKAAAVLVLPNTPEGALSSMECPYV